MRENHRDVGALAPEITLGVQTDLIFTMVMCLIREGKQWKWCEIYRRPPTSLQMDRHGSGSLRDATSLGNDENQFGP